MVCELYLNKPVKKKEGREKEIMRRKEKGGIQKKKCSRTLTY